MQAGKLRHFVQLFSPPDATQPDALGDVSAVPTVAFSAWAAIEPVTGTEFWMADATRAQVTHTITMRYDSRVGPKWRVQWGDGHRTRTFELGPPVSPEERQFQMAFTAIEKWGT